MSYFVHQKEKLINLRRTRNQTEVDAILTALTDCASAGDGNLLDLSIKAARIRCTVGEISDSLEKVHGRYVASTRMVSGAYISEYGESDDIKRTLDTVKVGESCDVYVKSFVTHMWCSCDTLLLFIMPFYPCSFKIMKYRCKCCEDS